LKRLLVVWLCCLLVASLSWGQERLFRWGTDPTGGAPFIYQENGKYVGFEVELAEYLAAKMGRKSVMVDGSWQTLPEQLQKPADVEKGIDCIFNGYELRKDLSDQYGVSRAYFAYRFELIVHKDEATITGWDKLDGVEVGVLNGTASHNYLKLKHPEAKITASDDVANVMQLVAGKRMRASVQDSPAATYFTREMPELKTVGTPVKAGYYVIYFRKSDKALEDELNRAIADGLKDGSFRKIYEKYGLWNADQENLVPLLDAPWPPAELGEAGHSNWPMIFRDLVLAAWMTLKLAFVSFPAAMLIGLLVAIGRVYGPRWLAAILGVYVEVIRGTPLLLQLYAIYYMAPVLLDQYISNGFSAWMTPFLCGVIGLAINYSAYEAENYRAGLLAIPNGQLEAGLALGMTRRQVIRKIVVPQAVRIVIPPVTNDFIALFKDTSVCSVILIVELTKKYNELYNFNRTIIVELVLITAILYLLMSYPLAILVRWMEKKYLPASGGTR
jgi:polar amino acid transport system substrate-binding protein